MAPAFAASSDFAVDKPAGVPCGNLLADFRCGIHARLRDRGFTGCTVFDCFGAGQRISQRTFDGRDWRASPDLAASMFRAFDVVRGLHELLWYLAEARELPPAHELRAELGDAVAETERLAGADPAGLAALDVAAHRSRVDGLLSRTSELVRAGAPGSPAEHRGADLIGRRMPGADLRGANLRGAYLIGADLRRADLRLADLIGADLRAADLTGADLSGSIFLTQFQVNAAVGDARTRLPAALRRPEHWPGRPERSAER